MGVFDNIKIIQKESPVFFKGDLLRRVARNNFLTRRRRNATVYKDITVAERSFLWIRSEQNLSHCGIRVGALRIL